jgi:hypothetical protein
MGNPTSKRAVLPAELLIQHFSAGTIQLDQSLNLVLVRLYEWASLASIQGIQYALEHVPGAQRCDLSIDLISAIAEKIISVAAPHERNLLRKSMEETLFYIVRPDPELTRSQFEVRLTRFLGQRGLSSLLRMFLSLHLFNIVWFHTAQSFRQLSATDELFLRYTREVEHTCRRIVTRCWKSHEIVLPFVKPFPEKLLESIEKRFAKP